MPWGRKNSKPSVQTAEIPAAQEYSPAQELLASLRINVAHETRNIQYAENPPKTITSSQLVGKNINWRLGNARSAWHIGNAYQRYRGAKPRMLIDEARKSTAYLEADMQKLPDGTQLVVASAIDRELLVKKTDGTSQTLSWPTRAEGYLWIPDDRPTDYSVFTVGDPSFSIDFSETFEPILRDAEKSVTLTYTEVSEDPNVAEERNYQTSLLLPEAYDETFGIPSLNYSY